MCQACNRKPSESGKLRMLSTPHQQSEPDALSRGRVALQVTEEAARPEEPRVYAAELPELRTSQSVRMVRCVNGTGTGMQAWTRQYPVTSPHSARAVDTSCLTAESA